MSNKNLNVEPSLREAVREYAWLNRSSVSAVISQIIVDYANGSFSVPPTPKSSSESVEIKYSAPPEYERALSRARDENVSLSEVIRFGLAARVSA